MKNAKSLEQLDVSANPSLRFVCDSLCDLSKLETLLLDDCACLRELPNGLGATQVWLTTVRARSCSLVTCPDGLALAVGLRLLDLGSNKIKKLPCSLGGSHQANFNTLRVDDNFLTELPQGLTNAFALEVIDCSTNSLTDIKVLTTCGSLISVNVSSNFITEIPRLFAGGPERARITREAKKSALRRARKVLEGFELNESQELNELNESNELKESQGFLELQESQVSDEGLETQPGDTKDQTRQVSKKKKLAMKLTERVRRHERAGAAAALADASRVVGLRKLLLANNKITRLPCCLGATLEVGGRDGRVVSLKQNPLQTSVANLVNASPNGMDLYLQRLAETHFAVSEMHDAPVFSFGKDNSRPLSATIPGLRLMSKQSVNDNTKSITDNAKSVTDNTKSVLHKKKKKHSRRVSWHAEDFAFLFQKEVETDSSFRDRHSQIEQARATRVAGRNAFKAQRARRWWRLAVFAVLKRTTKSQRAAIEIVEGLARMELLRDAVVVAAATRRKTEAGLFSWILDLGAPFDSLPHRLLVALAKKSRTHVAARHEPLWRAGDDGDFAVVLVEGTCRADLGDDGVGDENDFETTNKVLSAHSVLAASSLHSTDPPKRPGKHACAGVESWLNGTPRRRTLEVTRSVCKAFPNPASAFAHTRTRRDVLPMP